MPFGVNAGAVSCSPSRHSPAPVSGRLLLNQLQLPDWSPNKLHQDCRILYLRKLQVYVEA
uniref:Uncharacterized protein n=1 Tax=Setaria viridis TaxID=4556 RepID=A0A4U6W3E1_SETVI|nr:hypothetical protein SEVIR_2G414450v2 [Setaria viridis]